MIAVLFETHSTSRDNEAGLASGRFDVDLSQTGLRQAVELGRRHARDELAAVFCSDLQRSYRTAEVAFAGRDLPIIRAPRLRECDYGTLTRYPSAEIERLRSRYLYEPFPGGESYDQATRRVRDFLAGLVPEYEGRTVLIVGHRATHYGLERWLNGVSLEQAVTAPFHWQPGWRYELQGS